MADLIELNISVKDQTVKQAVTTVSRLEREIIKAVKAVDSHQISQKRFDQILAKSKQEYKAYAGNAGLATININKFVKAQRQANQELQNAAPVLGKVSQSVDRVAQSSVRYAAAAKSAGDATNRTRQVFLNTANSIAILDGPLGGVASRFSAFGVLIGRTGVLLGVALAGFSALGVVAAKSIKSFMDFEVQTAKINAILKTTGSQAGLTATEIENMSSRIAMATLESEEAIRSAAMQLLTFKNVGKDVFETTLKAAADMAALGFGTVGSEAVKLAKALEDPRQSLTSLSRSGITFTRQQRQLIASLVESGRQAEAMDRILANVNKQVGGAGEAAARDTMAGAFDTIGQAVSRASREFGDFIANTVGLADVVAMFAKLAEPYAIGRLPLEEQLEASIARMKELQTEGSGAKEVINAFLRTMGIPTLSTSNEELIALEAKIAALPELIRLEKQASAARSASNEVKSRTDAIDNLLAQSDALRENIGLTEQQVRLNSMLAAEGFLNVDISEAIREYRDNLVAAGGDQFVLTQAVEEFTLKLLEGESAGKELAESLRLIEASKAFMRTSQDIQLSNNALQKQIDLITIGKTATEAQHRVNRDIFEQQGKILIQSGNLTQLELDRELAAMDLNLVLQSTLVTLQESSDAAQQLANALNSAAVFSGNLDKSVDTLRARLAEAKGEQGAVLANTIEQMRAEAKLNADRIRASKGDVVADAQLAIDQSQIDEYARLTTEIESNSKAAKGAKGDVDELQQEIDKLNKTAAQGLTSFDKYNKAINHLNELRSEGLSQAAYSMEIERLNEELAKSLPMVNDVADAFGDFLARGMTDFKSFANSIFKSFQNMLAQMIATAARNRILISMGATGSAAGTAASAGPASAASNLAQGAGMMGNIGAATASVGSNMMAMGTTALGMGGAFTGSFGAGMAATMTGGVAGGASAFATGAGMMGTAGTAMSGFAMAAGAAVPVIAALALVIGIFSKKVKTSLKEIDSGVSGIVKGFDVAIKNFSVIEKTVTTSRFFGLSKKTRVTSETITKDAPDSPLIAAVAEVQQAVVTAAEAFGFGADAFKDFSYGFKLSLQGLSDDQKVQKINEELTRMGDAFADMLPHFSSVNELLEAAEHRYQIENRMLEALGRSTEVVIRNRERELAAIHELNREMLELVFSLEDAAQVAQQRFELEGRLLQVQEDVVELRKRELDTVHVLNKGLAARLQLLQAETDLQSSLGTFASAISQQQGLIRSAVDALVKPLQDAIERTKTQAEKSFSIFRAAADKTRGEAQNIVDIITGALSSRNIQSEAVELLRYRQSQQQLASFAGGDSFDESSLRRATEGVSIDTTRFFGSFEDYARDFFKTQISLTKLADKAQGELTDVEKQIDIAEKAYQVALGTFNETVDFNTALDQLLTDLAVYTETAARNQPFIDQIKAEGDRQVELLEQILIETTKQINGLLGIENTIADLVGTNVSVGEALSILGLEGKDLAGAVIALQPVVDAVGSHIATLDLTLSGAIDRLGVSLEDLITLDLTAGFENLNLFAALADLDFGEQLSPVVDIVNSLKDLDLSGPIADQLALLSDLNLTGAMEGVLEGLGGKFSALDLTTAGLNVGLVGLDGTIGILQSSVNSQAEAVLQLDSTIISQSVVVDALSGQVTALSSNVVNLDGTVFGLGTNVVGLGTNISDLGMNTNSLGININDLGATLSNAMSGLGSIVSGLSGAVSGLVASNKALASAQKSAAKAQVNAAVAQISSPLEGNIQSKLDAEAALIAAQEALSSTSATKTEKYKTGGISSEDLSPGFLDFLRKTGTYQQRMSRTRTVENPVYNQLQADIEKLSSTIAQEEAILAPAREQIKALGVTPTFADGGMHSGGMRLVGEQGPELEVTGPSRIYSTQQTKSMISGDSSETVAELRGLRQELSEFKAEQRKIGVENVKYNKKTYDLNREWDIVGLPEIRTS